MPSEPKRVDWFNVIGSFSFGGLAIVVWTGLFFDSTKVPLPPPPVTRNAYVEARCLTRITNLGHLAGPFGDGRVPYQVFNDCINE